MINDSMGFDRDVVYNFRLNGQDFNKVKNYFEKIYPSFF